MIWESGPWRRELTKNAKKLESLPKADGSLGELFIVERCVFLSAYAARKIWEAKKLSSNWDDRKIRCIRYDLVGYRPDILNWHNIEKHYDLGDPIEYELLAPTLVNQLIHSFTFLISANSRRKIDGFLFNSDRSRSIGLWKVKISDFVRLLRETADDIPTEIHMVRDHTGDFKGWRGTTNRSKHRPPKKT